MTNNLLIVRLLPDPNDASDDQKTATFEPANPLRESTIKPKLGRIIVLFLNNLLAKVRRRY